MLVTLSGIIVLLHPAMSVLDAFSIMAFAPFADVYTLLPSSTTMLVRSEHPLITLHPMLVTPLGMVIFVRPEQPEKARSSMLITPSGMVMVVRPEHPQYLQLVVYQYVLV